MAFIITGRHMYDFTNDKNQRFTGVKLHCLQELSSPTEGQLTEVISVGSDKPIYPMAIGFPFGAVVTPIYNKYGKVNEFILKSVPGDAEKEQTTKEQYTSTHQR